MRTGDLAVAAADLPREFQQPVDHADRWLWLALAALAVVALYFLAVTWWARPRRPAAPTTPTAP
ncbi:MAG: hypothetical protein QM638_06110, partial [Nocardioides sp.]|uniref:hypothetical protein n=1 Tax=Nocardioides sp. TaxID=35761 RepID=UPI0039E2394A